MDIIVHENTRKLLGKISSGDLPHHAFLFFGPEGIGKNLVAREFAAALLGCPGEDPSRKQDFLLSVPTAKKGSETRKGGKRKEPKKSVFVEDIREAGVFLSRFPAESPRRVVVIDDADRMTESAQNALLKTLEEPNTTSVLVLVTARPGVLRDTVVSRTFRIPFSLVPESVISAGVNALFSDSSEPVPPFFYSLGRPGIIVGAASDPELFAKRKDQLRPLFKIGSLSFSERLALSEKLSESPAEAADLFEWWVSGLRNRRNRNESPKTTVSYYRLLEEIEKTTRSLRDTNMNARLLIDRLFLVSF